MSRDPLVLYFFFLYLQLAAGAPCSRCRQPIGPACAACCHHHRFLNAYGHIPMGKSDPLIPTTPDPDWFVGVLAYLTTNNPIEVTS